MITWETLGYCPKTKSILINFSGGERLMLPLKRLKDLTGFGNPEWIAELVDTVLAEDAPVLEQYCSVFTFEPCSITFGLEMIEELIRQGSLGQQFKIERISDQRRKAGSAPKGDIARENGKRGGRPKNLA